MSVKERLHRLIDDIPDPVAHELEHYAGYLVRNLESEGWEQFSLTLLAHRYESDEVDYTAHDARSRPANG